VRYLHRDPAKRAFGGRLEVTMEDGSVVQADKAVANAHPNGAAPWTWDDYINKWRLLRDQLASDRESDRFIRAVQTLGDSDADALRALLPVADLVTVTACEPTGQGIFDHPG
jgi:2-methylcitrate dehydratase